MFTAMEIIPYSENKYLERNIRRGGYKSRGAAEAAVLRRGLGFVIEHGQTQKTVSVIMNGKIWVVEKGK